MLLKLKKIYICHNHYGNELILNKSVFVKSIDLPLTNKVVRWFGKGWLSNIQSLRILFFLFILKNLGGEQPKRGLQEPTPVIVGNLGPAEPVSGGTYDPFNDAA